MTKNQMRNIGYACLNLDVGTSGFKTCRLENLTNDRLTDLIRKNILTLEAMIDYNIKHQIKLYRISSSLIPFGSHPKNTLNWSEIFKSDFDRIAKKISDNGIRISMHPGQYTVLNSLNPSVVERSIEELEYHCDVLESLGGTSKK